MIFLAHFRGLYFSESFYFRGLEDVRQKHNLSLLLIFGSKQNGEDSKESVKRVHIIVNNLSKYISLYNIDNKTTKIVSVCFFKALVCKDII